jgi:hypothetical protein
MTNRVRSAHAWAALLLLAAACDSGGGDKEQIDGGGDAALESDAGSPEGGSDAGGEAIDTADAETETPMDASAHADAETDASPESDAAQGMDATSDAGLDSEIAQDTGSSSDADTDAAPDDAASEAGSDAGDAGNDAGVDSGVDAALPPCSTTAVVAATGATVGSSDGHFSLRLAAAALSADANVRICLVAPADVPSAVTSDGRLGDVYVIETTATFGAGTVTFSNHSAFPGPDSAAAFNPVRVRTLPSAGGPTAGANPVLSFSKRVVSSESASTLSATISAPGYVYVAPFEAAGVYQVDIRSPKTSYVTGEVIDLSARVGVDNAPSVTRVLEAELQGCDTEIINTATPNYVIAQTSGTRAGCAEYVTVSRVSANIEDNSILVDGHVVDLHEADNSPPRFFCKRPGTGTATTRLLFKNGAATDLVVEKQLQVVCTFSGDWIAIYDQVPITRGAGAGFNIGTTYTPRSYVSIAPPAITYTALAPDAVRFPEPTPVQSTQGPATFSAAAAYVTAGPTTNSTNSVTFNYDTNGYAPTYANGSGFFRFLPDATVTINANSSIINCQAPSAAELDIVLSDRNGPESTVGIIDQSVNLISIRAKFPGTSGATLVQRWVDATALASHEAVPFLTSSQQTALASLGAASEYAVGFYRVVWDEDRRIWDDPDSRVLPIACGVELLFEAADVVP